MTLSLSCPAKINLTLSVGPPEPGPGSVAMHPIASWMVAVNLADSLELERSRGERSSFTLRPVPDAPRHVPVDWPLEKDLAVRAHALLEQTLKRTLPVQATILKRIPTGAGLGGGSSDAATMMRALNSLFDLNLTDQTLVELSRQLGSDIAFFAAAARSAIVTGFGETITALPPRKLDLVLILPELACPTGPVYRAFDALGQAALNTQRVHDIAALDPLPPDAPFNDLAAAAMTVEPRLADLHDHCTDLLQTPVHVTGSGAAMFALAPDPDRAAQMAATLPVPAVATHTLT